MALTSLRMSTGMVIGAPRSPATHANYTQLQIHQLQTHTNHAPKVGHDRIDDEQPERLLDHARRDARQEVELRLVRVGARVEDLALVMCCVCVCGVIV